MNTRLIYALLLILGLIILGRHRADTTHELPTPAKVTDAQKSPSTPFR